jgi:hypothetical protein
MKTERSRQEAATMRERTGGSSRHISVTIVAVAIAGAAIGAVSWIAGRSGETPPLPAAGSDVSRSVACSAAPYGNRITGIVEGDVEVTEHGTVCEIRGTVRGSVIVRDDGAPCDEDDAITAADVLGGTVQGDIVALGGACVMVFLEDGARVEGNIVYRADGNLGFLGDGEGAWVGGSLLLQGGRLWAHGASTTNRIGGDLMCDGGTPRKGLGSGSETNWDGWHDDVDGELGGSYTAC